MLTLDCFCSLSWDELDELEEVGPRFKERLDQLHVLWNIDALFHYALGSKYGSDSCSFDQV